MTLSIRVQRAFGKNKPHPQDLGLRTDQPALARNRNPEEK